MSRVLVRFIGRGAFLRKTMATTTPIIKAIIRHLIWNLTGNEEYNYHEDDYDHHEVRHGALLLLRLSVLLATVHSPLIVVDDGTDPWLANEHLRLREIMDRYPDFVLICVKYHIEISDKNQAQDSNIRGERLWYAYPAQSTDRRMPVQDETLRLNLEPEIIQAKPQTLIGRGFASGIVVELPVNWVFLHADLNWPVVCFIIKQKCYYLLVCVIRQLYVFYGRAEYSPGGKVSDSGCAIGKPASLIYLVRVHANLPFLSVVQILEPLGFIRDQHACFPEFDKWRYLNGALEVILCCLWRWCCCGWGWGWLRV